MKPVVLLLAGSAGQANGAGAGLGLALARRLARSVARRRHRRRRRNRRNVRRTTPVGLTASEETTATKRPLEATGASRIIRARCGRRQRRTFEPDGRQRGTFEPSSQG